MLHRLSVFSILLFVSLAASAQNKYTISGYVKDSLTGENLITATVQIKGSTLGAYTNQYGFFSLSAPQGSYELSVSYIGYQTVTHKLELTSDARINFQLSPVAKEIHEVVIQAERKDNNVTSSEMGKVDLPMEKIKALPVIMGETDVLKTIQLLPGVQGGAEGTSGFYVRGGGPDQNLIMLDEAVVYNSAHLFGFFSVFNSDAILNTTLYKSGMPAEYGGRISSVLDISMKEGNNKTYHASGGIGLIASRLTVEGPIKKDKSSFIVSGRRTYIDVLTKPYVNTTKYKGTGYYFYDLNVKTNYRFSDKNQLFLSGYFGRDVFSFNSSSMYIGIPWGNATATLRWNHLFNSKLFMNADVIYNDYNFEITGKQDNFQVTLYSGIRDANAKVDFSYFASAHHEIKFGTNYVYHIFLPSNVSGKSGEVEFKPEGIKRKYAHEGAVYIQDKITLGEQFELNAGIRFSLFEQIGPYKKLLYGGFSGFPTDSVVYKNGEPIKTYSGLEPRILFRYSFNRVSSVKASFTINNQYIHLVSNNGTTLPTDIWVPSSLKVKPQTGTQYSLGYFRNFRNDMFETSVEVYYKKMQNQIEYKEGYTPQPNEDLEESFVFGKGDSKGIELYINKQTGKVTGWIGYTLSYTNRQFPDLNDGKKFPYRYDRRHNTSLVATYKLNSKWSLSGVFVYQTGIAYTLPIGKYFIEGNVITEYGAINSYRLKAYNRLDLSANYEGKKRKKFQDGWSFSVYNAYNRKNPFFIYNDITGTFLNDSSVSVQAKQVTMFPIIPSVTWNFKF